MDKVISKHKPLFKMFSGTYLRGMYCTNHTGRKATTHDLIGPPDPLSNIRPVIFHVPKNERPLEKEFRLRRQEVQKWNEEFWNKHNDRFIKERKEHIKKIGGPEQQTLTADEMSVFYKKFLDKNWKNHLQYNIEWYRKNIGLVVLALKVKALRVKQFLENNNR